MPRVSLDAELDGGTTRRQRGRALVGKALVQLVRRIEDRGEPFDDLGAGGSAGRSTQAFS
eukprot:CAMPEP_0197192810 /NCGR_PEP_ID=MMETSP1423-20130617/25787_1 /TAXON_ID=476441 /ORGANISM="Pseudo-nitzschia heimii, Strain UNC1101" /LENGTH=59 /DNA_ID=CAMNT_0042645789 /DNA_START=127 /DNA_END=303 /DNA_ORIENTATION=+